MNDQKDSHLYSVGEVCAKTGVTRKTLFYYDRIGLLLPSERHGSQQFKRYDNAQIKRLEAILEYRHAGLMIAEIRELLDGSDKDHLQVLEKAMERLRKEQDEKQQEIANLTILIAEEKEKTD